MRGGKAPLPPRGLSKKSKRKKNNAHLWVWCAAPHPQVCYLDNPKEDQGEMGWMGKIGRMGRGVIWKIGRMGKIGPVTTTHSEGGVPV